MTRTHAQTSTESWPTAARRKTWTSCASALVVVVIASSCAPKVIVEAPPGCPELTPAALERLLSDDTPEEIRDWYWNEYDPFCEALYEASRDHRE